MRLVALDEFYKLILERKYDTNKNNRSHRRNNRTDKDCYALEGAKILV